ncbi:ejaculatory bulb-specific protein 3-like [Chrysoperla carnea]|uniref:ejaculatory bulb-specific protein 3-like n=1 Tax=Chrysoperla carnea TaxID=189513 RepID=UPI001D0777D4|nr:ejaculatory bulb-specific protein 3-like [Chrysoperla carnea]
MLKIINSTFVLLYLLFAVVSTDEPKGTYTTKYDNINLDDILSNKRLLKNYVKCLLSEGPCTNDGAELKQSIPDAIETNCTKCTQTQKEGSQKVMYFLIDNEKEAWAQLEKKFDPTGSYKKRYLANKDYKDVLTTVKSVED